jgi:hypothetical protein
LGSSRASYPVRSAPDSQGEGKGLGPNPVEQLVSAGIHPTLVPMHGIDDGINAVRATLPHCYFHEEECAQGIKALKAYRKEWGRGPSVLQGQAHAQLGQQGADGFRYLSMAWRELQPDPVEPTPADIIKEMTRRRSLNELLEEYDEEQAELELS